MESHKEILDYREAVQAKELDKLVALQEEVSRFVSVLSAYFHSCSELRFWTHLFYWFSWLKSGPVNFPQSEVLNATRSATAWQALT